MEIRATIPALDSQVQLLQDIMAARQRLAETCCTVPVSLIVVADTRGWHAPAHPYVWCDVDGLWQQMRASPSPCFWSASYTIPPGREIVTIAIEKMAGPERPCATHTVRIQRDAGDTVIVTNAVRRDYATTVVLHCDGRDKSLRSSPCVLGDVPSLGAWDFNRRVKMHDDGQSHGDVAAGDDVFSCAFTAPPAVTELRYVFSDGEHAGE